MDRTNGRRAAEEGGDRSPGFVALTFDDGPNPLTTEALLGALTDARARATLFDVGSNVTEHPALVRRQAASGMWIANHSFTHPHLDGLDRARLDDELGRTQRAIERAGGGRPVLFRPPYGEVNGTLEAAAAALELTVVTWDVDSRDWDGATAAEIVAASDRLEAGGVMLMHDGYGATIAAIPQIVARLRRRGLRPGMIDPLTGRAVAPAISGDRFVA